MFNFIGDTTLAQPIQILAVTNGTYLADSLQTGMYHVRFTPDPALFPGVAPLYYTNGDTWSTAEAIGLPCFLNSGNINSNTLNVLNGSGVIAGTVIIDTTYLKSPTVPYENALVKLFNISNQVVAFTYSDVLGNFQFTAIPSGNYYIRLDVPYIPQLNDHSITVVGNDIVIGADFSILIDGIYAVDNIELGIEEANLLEVAVYPNPAKDKIYISNGTKADLSVELSTIDGQIIHKSFIGIGNTELDLLTLADGIYFIRLGASDLRKLIVKK